MTDLRAFASRATRLARWFSLPFHAVVLNEDVFGGLDALSSALRYCAPWTVESAEAGPSESTLPPSSVFFVRGDRDGRAVTLFARTVRTSDPTAPYPDRAEVIGCDGRFVWLISVSGGVDEGTLAADRADFEAHLLRPPDENGLFAAQATQVKVLAAALERLEQASKEDLHYIGYLSHQQNMLKKKLTETERALFEYKAQFEPQVGRLQDEISRLQEENAKLHCEYDRLQSHNEQLAKRVDDILSSTSWRITMPLRRLGAVRLHLHRLFRR